MQLLLNVTTGPSAGERILLRQGQAAKVGRTDWADFSIPDEEMNELHFAISCESSGCCIQDLEDAFTTRLNGQPIVADRLSTGDMIEAGESTFQVKVLGEGHAEIESDDTETAETSTVVPAETTEPPKPKTPWEICKFLELTDEAKELAKNQPNVEVLLAQLIEAKHFPDAVCLRAFISPKCEAVRWAASCVRQVIPHPTPMGNDALCAAETWAEECNEDNRRAAETAAVISDYADATSWIALAAFWSEGSLSSVDQPPVPPAEHLTAKAIMGALMMAATSGDPLAAEGHYLSWLQS